MRLAKQSPRIEENAIKWYVGDTFTLYWNMQLKEAETGTPIPYQPTDKLCWHFFKRGELIKSMEYTNIPITNVVEMEIDLETSRLFDVGKYLYCIKLNGENITTVGAMSIIEVEKCH